MKPWKVTYEKLENIFCTNIVYAEDLEIVDEYYKKYMYIDISEATEEDVRLAEKKHMPIIYLPETEAVECCPHCGGENVYPNYNVKASGYKAICKHCGEEIMLCDECFHADDNPGHKCDWCELVWSDVSEGTCFRGYTTHKKKVRGGNV